MEANWVQAAIARRRPSGLIGVALGFLVGVLIAALTIPDRPVEVRSAAESADPNGSVPGLDSGDGPLDSVSSDSQEGTAPSVDAGGADIGDVSGSAQGDEPGPPSGESPRGGGDAGRASEAPGVDDGSITIGFGLPDLGAIGALGPGYDQGDPREHVTAILDALRAEGRLPVHGRDIRPVYRSYNIISPEAQRAACEGLGADEEVFAAVPIHNFAAANECLAREYGVPTLTSEGQLESVMARSHPNLFTMQMSADRLARNFVEWADRKGVLDGERIGVYYPTEPELADMVEREIIGRIESKGHTVAARVQTADYTTGGPTDSVAVQRFRSNQVSVAILYVSPVAKTNFFTQAQAQLYEPRYLENDFAFSTTSTGSKTYPGSYFDGTAGFTGMRFGEAPAGIAESPEATRCMEAIAARTGQRISRTDREAEYIAANQACDEIYLLVDALEQAGPALSRDGLIRALEQTRDRRMGIHGNVSFSAQRHHGVDTWRELTWRQNCSCWVVRGDQQSLFLP